MKKFSSNLNGYNKAEVNSFVDDVTKNYENMLNLLKERDKEITDLNNKLKTYIEMETSLNKALLVAENASSGIKRLAQEEYNIIIDDAKKNASRIINTALLKAEKYELDAENLRRKINTYKKRIRQIIEEHLEIIDIVDDVDF